MRPPSPNSVRPSAPAKLILITGALVLLVLEGLSYLILALLPSALGVEVRRTRTILEEQRVRALAAIEASDARTQLDPSLGWIYRPSFTEPGERINPQGARSTRDYAPEPEPGTLRIMAFGDSFMHGNEVAVEDAWSSQLERRHPEVEVLNFGVGGYGTDQAFLRYMQKRSSFGEGWVLMGFAPVDLRRSVNVYRRFISDQEWPLIKPRFVENLSGELRLLPNPLPNLGEYRRLVDAPRATVRELGRQDFWYEPLIWRNPLYDLSASVRLASYFASRAYRSRVSPDRILRHGVFNTRSEAFSLQVRILSAFVDSVAATGAVPRVVIFPDRTSIERFRAGGATIYAPLVEALRAKGIEPLDLVEAFSGAMGEEDVGLWFAPGGHYSTLGNKVVADAVAGILPIPEEGKD